MRKNCPAPMIFLSFGVWAAKLKRIEQYEPDRDRWVLLHGLDEPDAADRVKKCIKLESVSICTVS